MKFADLLKQNTASTSAAVITLGAAPTGFRTLAQAIAAGELTAGDQTTFMVKDAAGKFELSLFTVTSSTTLTRVEVRRSSNGDAAETFGAGAVVANMPDGEWLSQLLSADDGIDLATVSSVTGLEAGDTVPLIRDGAMRRVAVALLQGSTVPPADTTKPTTPTNLTPSAVGQAGYTITFTPGTDSGSGVQRSDYRLNGGAWNPVSGGAVGNTFTTSGRTSGSQDAVEVTTLDMNGNRSDAASINVTLASAPGGDTTGPVYIGGISKSNITSSGFTMGWTLPTDANGIQKQQSSINGGTDWMDHDATTTQRIVSGVGASATFQLRVRAYDPSNNPSNVLSDSVTTSAAAVNPYDSLVALAGVVPAGTDPEVWSGSGEANSENLGTRGTVSKQFAAGVDGTIIFEMPNNSDWWAMNVFTSGSTAYYANESLVGIANAYSIGQNYLANNKSAYNNAGGVVTTVQNQQAQHGDVIKLERINSNDAATCTLVISVARAATPTAFVEVFRCSKIPTGLLPVRWYYNRNQPSITKIRTTGMVAWE